MEHRFYNGQEVVTLCDYDGFFKKDEVFTVAQTKDNFCQCKGIYLVDIGMLKPDGASIVCTPCMMRYMGGEPVMWFSSELFAPLDELCNIEELQDAEGMFGRKPGTQIRVPKMPRVPELIPVADHFLLDALPYILKLPPRIVIPMKDLYLRK